MRFLLVVLLILFPAAAMAESEPASYYVPPGQFNAVMQVMDSGLANIFGFFQSATGSFEFDEAGKSIGNLRLAIDARSLTAANPQNQNDLAKLLGIYENPEIRFTALDKSEFKDGKASIKGTLAFHGASKPVTMEAVLNHIGKSPHGGGMWSSEGDALGLSLRGSFKRADFGMTDDPEMPARFGDMITLQLEMQAIKQ